MKPLDDLLPSILPYAPSCAAPTAYFGIRQAAIEFCERTRLWKFEDEFEVVETDDDQLLAPADAVIHEIDEVRFDDIPLEPKTTQWLDEQCSGWREDTGTPSYLTQLEPNILRLVPRGTGTVNLSVWLKPSQDADELPDFIVDQHRETIAHGALARILLIPNQSFSNPNMAAAFAQMFQAKLDALSAKGYTGQQRAPMRTKATFY
jgi:hypothetical protein